jgi:Na+/H+ antiporter NhaD/arsenite permease-like protein
VNNALPAIIIFILTYAAIISEKVKRIAAAFLGALFLILFKVFTLNESIQFVNWENC